MMNLFVCLDVCVRVCAQNKNTSRKEDKDKRSIQVTISCSQYRRKKIHTRTNKWKDEEKKLIINSAIVLQRHSSLFSVYVTILCVHKFLCAAECDHDNVEKSKLHCRLEKMKDSMILHRSWASRSFSFARNVCAISTPTTSGGGGCAAVAADDDDDDGVGGGAVVVFLLLPLHIFLDT